MSKLKALQPDTPVIVVGGSEEWDCDSADHFLDSFEPKRLLELIQEIEPAQTKAIEDHNEALALQPRQAGQGTKKASKS